MPKNHDMSGDAPAISKDVPNGGLNFLLFLNNRTNRSNNGTNMFSSRIKHFNSRCSNCVLVEQKLGSEQSPTKQQSSNAYGDLVRDLPYFNYDEDDDSTFDAWYKRYGRVIDDRGSSLPDGRKRDLIIDKLDKATYKTYSEHVSPLEPRDIDLSTTVRH
uniref:DUF7083 domain-containing protein n=1 Tax=Haemonchus placei TaxID=6290 RepID=A0A0N4WYM2_HAEPC